MYPRFILFSLLVFACTGPVLAWQQEQVYETMEVERYLIQVNVTDRDGEPVKGLDRSDFEIRIGRENQTVETLEYFQLDSPDAARALSLSQHGRRMFILFFDMRYNSERGILAARRDAIEFISNDLQPQDLVSVVVATARSGVLPVVNFTSDTNQILKALGDLGLSQASGRERGPAGYFTRGLMGEYLGVMKPRDFLDGDLIGSAAYRLATDDSFNGGTINSLEPLVMRTMRLILDEARKQERMDYASNVVSFTESLASYARALSFIRGRKNLILFSAGYDGSQLTGIDSRELMANAEASMSGETFGIDSTQLGNAIVQNRTDELIRSLQGSGTVVFAIDSSGLDRQTSRKVGIQSLNTLALDTGGRLFENQNRFRKPLQDIERMTNEYYMLSVVPAGRFQPGDSARLRVDVNRPGVRVHAQRGITIRPDFQTLNPVQRQMHIADYIAKDVLSYEIPIQMQVVPIQEVGGLMRLTVQLDIEEQYFQDVSGEQGIEFFVMAVDQERNVVVDSTAAQYKLRLDTVGEELASNGLRFVTSVVTPPGTHRIKAVVRDAVTGRVGSTIETLEIKTEAPTVTVRLLDHLARPTLEGKRDNLVAGVDLGYPFKLDSRYFSPRADFRVAADRQALFFFLVNQPKIGALKLPDVKTLIRRPNGELTVVPNEHLKLDFSRDSMSSSLTPLLLMVDLPELALPAGDYQLLTQIHLQNGQPQRLSTAFTVH